jgi:hypothetical protein
MNDSTASASSLQRADEADEVRDHAQNFHHQHFVLLNHT